MATTPQVQQDVPGDPRAGHQDQGVGPQGPLQGGGECQVDGEDVRFTLIFCLSPCSACVICMCYTWFVASGVIDFLHIINKHLIMNNKVVKYCSNTSILLLLQQLPICM